MPGPASEMERGAWLPDQPPSRPKHPSGWLLGSVAAVAAAATIVLAVVAHRTPYFPYDLTLTREVQAIHAAWFVAPLALLSLLGFPPLVDIVAGAIIFALYLAGQRWAAISALFAAVGIAGLNFLFKILVARPRPPSSLVHVAHHIPNGSFPAGHVMTFTAFFGFLCYFLWYEFAPSWWRTLCIAVTLASIVLMGPARIAAGEHWPSDVLGGYLIGITWLAITIRFHGWGAERVGRSIRR